MCLFKKSELLENCIISREIDFRNFKRNIEKATEEIKIRQQRIDKANKILGSILICGDWEHKGKFRPVKNTTKQEVYKAIIMLNELLETPYRTNYGLLKGEDK